MRNFFALPYKQLHQPHLRLVAPLRNGENQRQKAVLYDLEASEHPLAWNHFEPMRALNLESDVSAIALTDLDRAMRVALWIASAFEKNNWPRMYIAVGVKHGNTCGAGVGKTPSEALIKMI